MFKNATIRQITILIVIAIALLNALLLFILFSLDIVNFSSADSTPLYIILACAVFSSVVFFLLISYILENFVFRKIKLIYSIISGKRDSEKMVEMPKSAMDTSIDNVNRHVQEWVESTSKEISSLKSLEEYRKNYVGVISHELKTPIFTIQGYIHTLLEGGLYDEKINLEYLQRAAKNINRLETIVEDLELINTLESGQNQIFKSNFEIFKLIKDVKVDLESMAKEKEIEIVLGEGKELNTKVNADINAIRQVLVNLISNSIKYGKQNGKTIINQHILDNTVLIEIEDDGIGIDNKHIKHLFDRFYRVDPSRSRMIGGSGLGLSIVKHIIEVHDQTINVSSKLGEGSTFSFTLEKS